MGAGPFAATTVVLEWPLLNALFNSIEQAKIPIAIATAASFLDMVPPRMDNPNPETLYPFWDRCQVGHTTTL
jgi:hypothetical protein